ncbi:MAG: hypothetical protein ACRESG_06075 [Gammaproteobacteria bacterium]
MYEALLIDKRFFELLLRLDEDLAAHARAAGCPRCGQVLHAAHYRRKPRGVPEGLIDQYGRRLSFCCAGDTRRHRSTPSSLRFLGRKVYLGAVVVLVSALRCGATPVRMARLQELIGVSRRTVNRWRVWWTAVFPLTRCWAEGAGLFAIPVSSATLPASLLSCFAGPAASALLALLRFVLPITGGDEAVRAM